MANDLRKLRSLKPSSAARGAGRRRKNRWCSRAARRLTGRSSRNRHPSGGGASRIDAFAGGEKKGSEFVLDLDTFSRNFEAEEQARLRAEEEARRKKEEELRRWSEAEARKREVFERQRESESQRSGATSATGADTGSRRGALDLLKKKAATRSPEDDAAAKKAKADADLDQSMRAALQYLAEVARELNGVNPTAERPYDYVFLGRLPAVKLSNAFADLRSRKIDGKDHGDHLFFRFRAQPASSREGDLARGRDCPLPRVSQDAEASPSRPRPKRRTTSGR